MTAFRKRWRLSHDTRVLLLSLASGLPAIIVAAILLWKGGFSAKTQWTLGLLIGGCWLGFAFAVRDRVIYPLHTVANLLGAVREGDFSVRARAPDSRDPLGEVMIELNALSATLRAQRFGEMEATALLRKVMEEIDVAVFTFDEMHRLSLVNRAGERLVGRPAELLLGCRAEDLHLAECLNGEPARTLQMTFPGGAGRYGMRRTSFREEGRPHQLLVLTDLSRALREEERQAWQRLIRVLGHELNNSLTPIKSMAGSLEALMSRANPPDDWRDDMKRGLSVIGSRAEALNRFMRAYTQLARLPQPQLSTVEVGAWVRRVAGLETRLHVAVVSGPNVCIRADGDQLDQLLINLVRNAVDASIETGGGVRVGWKKNGGYVDVFVRDEGPGLPNTTNLFVPFFTTKPGGSGIGLVLSRQIAEAHGGSLALENVADGHGCIAQLRLPI